MDHLIEHCVKLTRIYEINLLALLLCLFCGDRESVGELHDVLLGYIYPESIVLYVSCLYMYGYCGWYICLCVIQDHQNAMSAASSYSFDHVRVISRTALFLSQAAHTAEEQLGSVHEQTSHTTRSADTDIKAMWEAITNNQLHLEMPGRQTHTLMIDAREKGLEKIEAGWLVNFLKRTDAVTGVQSSEECDSTDEPQL